MDGHNNNLNGVKMKTSVEWWNQTKSNPDKLNTWLQKQCYGELQAFERISELANKFNNKTLMVIAKQEETHFNWIKDYLIKNNIEPITEHEERYWKQINMTFNNLEEAAAVGHHAETMRLERIKVIASDTEQVELAEIFNKILKDEEFHARAFKDLSNEESIEMARLDHEQGMLELGLVI